MRRFVAVVAAAAIASVALAAPSLPFSPYALWSAPISDLGATPPLIAGDLVYGAPSSTEAYDGSTGFHFTVTAVQKSNGLQVFNTTVPYRNDYQSYADTASLAASWSGANPEANTSVVAAGFVGTNMVFGLDGRTGALRWKRIFTVGPFSSALSVRAIASTTLGATGAPPPPPAAAKIIRDAVGEAEAAKSLDIIVVVFADRLVGLHAMTGATVWGPVQVQGGQALENLRVWNVEIHQQRLAVFTSGGAVQAYDVFTGGVLWVAGSPTATDMTLYQGRVHVTNGVVAVQALATSASSTTRAKVVAFDGNTGHVLLAARTACPAVGLYGPTTDGVHLVFNPPNAVAGNLAENCRIEVYSIRTKHLVWKSRRFYYPRPAAIGVGQLFAAVTVDEQNMSDQLFAFNMTSGAVDWTASVALGRFRPTFEGRVLYGQSAHAQETQGVKSLIAVQVLRPVPTVTV